MLFGYVCFLVYKNGMRFFTYFWSIVDISILSLFFMWFMVSIAIFNEVANAPNLVPEVIGDPEMFFPVGHIIPELDFSGSLLAALGLVSWLKILKYFTLIDWFHAFVRVIERCFCNLLLFTGLLFVVLFGFAVALHIGYGDEDNLFSTLHGSFVAVMVAPAGGVDFGPVFAKEDLLGPMLIFVYVILIILLLLNTFMAICVDTYSVCTFEIGEVYRVRKDHPTSVFVWTYFNSLKGTKLVGKESEDDKGGPGEQQIVLTSLPEPVQACYMDTRTRMQALQASAEKAILDAKIEKMLEAGAVDVTGGRRDSFTSLDQSQTLKLTDGQTGNMLALQNGSGTQPSPTRIGVAASAANNTLSVPDASRGAGRAPSNASSEDDSRSQSEQADFEDPSSITVKRVQLQRMLEDDSRLREICGTGRAVDVVRRFRVDQSGVDPYEAVAQLQAKVTQKLEEIEARGLNLTFNEMELLRSVSTELHSALTESQKEWRAELLTVMQMANLLSSALIELTKKLEAVQRNHNDLAMRGRQ